MPTLLVVSTGTDMYEPYDFGADDRQMFVRVVRCLPRSAVLDSALNPSTRR